MSNSNSSRCRSGLNCSSSFACRRAPPSARPWNRSSARKRCIATYTAYVGRGSPRFWLGLNPQLPDEAFAEIVILSKDVEARERIKARLEKAVADGALSEARVRGGRF